VSVGDRSTGDPLPLQAQQTDTYLGKVIHITPEGKPAPGNPAIGSLPLAWTWGHRTPQGLAFAPDGRLWETEHGPRGGDELNLIEKGKNYGWPVIVHGINYPGTKIGDAIVEKPGLEQPRYYWDPIIAPSAWCSMRAICSRSGSTARSSARLSGQAIFRLELGKDDKVVNEEPLLMDLNARIRDVRVFQDGAVYVLTEGAGGKLLKLTRTVRTLIMWRHEISRSCARKDLLGGARSSLSRLGFHQAATRSRADWHLHHRQRLGVEDLVFLDDIVDEQQVRRQRVDLIGGQRSLSVERHPAIDVVPHRRRVRRAQRQDSSACPDISVRGRFAFQIRSLAVDGVAPWHPAQPFERYSCAPSLTVPFPRRSSSPVGPMEISHALDFLRGRRASNAERARLLRQHGGAAHQQRHREHFKRSHW
jgi:hypothetical protein